MIACVILWVKILGVLTCIASRCKRDECRRENHKDNEWPGRGVQPGTANQGANVVSLLCKRIRPGNLQQRLRKDNEGLDQVPTAPLPACKRVGPEVADLEGEVAHDGQQAGGIEADGQVVHVGVDVAQAVAGPPGLQVVVAPEEGVDDGAQVLDLDVEDEEGGGELAVAVEEAQGHEADEVGEDAEEDAADEVGCEGRGCVRGRSRVAGPDGGDVSGDVLEERVHFKGGGWYREFGLVV